MLNVPKYDTVSPFDRLRVTRLRKGFFINPPLFHS